MQDVMSIGLKYKNLLSIWSNIDFKKGRETYVQIYFI